jgi:hypothetical protein
MTAKKQGNKNTNSAASNKTTEVMEPDTIQVPETIQRQQASIRAVADGYRALLGHGSAVIQ